jgi:uncharacterized integral membrane protein (TIGR00697 family)
MNQPRMPYKYLMVFVVAFVACYMTQAVLLNRLIDIHGLYITGGTFIYFVSPLISDVVTEVYGYRIARQLLWLGLFSVIFLTISVNIFIRLPSPPFWEANAAAYVIALGSLFRNTVAGIFAILIGQFVNIYLISKWKIILQGRFFWLRSVGASIIGDGLTVTFAIVLIFVGRVPAEKFAALLIPELIIMVIFTALGGLPATLLVKLVSKAENLNSYDIGVNFNPFKLTTKEN